MRKLLLGALLLLNILGFSQIQKIEVEKPLKTTKVGPMGSVIEDKFNEICTRLKIEL